MNVSFNDYAYINIFDMQQFEEKIYMVIEGEIIDSDSKKLKTGQESQIVLHPAEYWDNRMNIREDTETIGDIAMVKQQYDDISKNVLMFRMSVPVKSYENIRAYLTYKQRGEMHIIGTDLKYRKGEIYYFRFSGG